MDPQRDASTLEGVVSALSASNGDALSKAHSEGVPDRKAVIDWGERVKNLVLHQRDRGALRSEIPTVAERLERLLAQGAVPPGLDPGFVVTRFLDRLPAVRALLAEDVEAAFEGDPAAKSYAEILVAYPSIQAIAMQRLAHVLYELGAHPLARIMTERAHSLTGIDINPGARIGRRFFIDHGTGVVIGETCEIGDRVVLYQGVTLGALAPRKGQPLRGVKRHPTLEDDVTIYAGTTILGGDVVIGRGSVIGGNVWLTESVPPCSKVQMEPPRLKMQQDADCEQEHGGRQLHWDI
ncbi:MAG: serine O-acetyltransferase EpsC [Myxococcota bacterium]